MESKYFTPEIEDIRVGYECEITADDFKKESLNEWVPFTFSIPFSSRLARTTTVEEALLLKKIRVPYLRQEQIEAEGWKREITITNSDCATFSKGRYELFFSSIDKPDGSPLVNLIIYIIREEGYDDIYMGKCPCINTFRQISKLLNI